MSLVTPSIDPRLAAIAPGFRALSILVEAAPVTHPEVAPAVLTKACQQMLNDDVPWADAHLPAGMRYLGLRRKTETYALLGIRLT